MRAHALRAGEAAALGVDLESAARQQVVGDGIVRSHRRLEMRVVLAGAEHADVGEAAELMQAGGEAGEIFLRPHLAGLAAPVGAHDRQRQAERADHVGDAGAGAVERLLLAERNVEAVHQHGADRPRGAQAGARLVMAQQREGTVDAAGEGEHAAPRRGRVDRHDLVGGDAHRRVFGAPQRPGFLEFLEAADQRFGHRSFDVDRAAFAHGDDRARQHREVMHLQRRRQHVAGDLEEHPPLPGEGIEGGRPRDGVAVAVLADGNAQTIGQ